MYKRTEIQTPSHHSIVYGFDDTPGYSGYFISIHHFGGFTDEFGPDAGDLRTHYYDTRRALTERNHALLEYLPGKRPHAIVSGLKRFHLTKERYLRFLRRLGIKAVRMEG